MQFEKKKYNDVFCDFPTLDLNFTDVAHWLFNAQFLLKKFSPDDGFKY